MMQNETVSERHLTLLWHTLGVTPERREPYRNHFVADPGHYAMPDLQGLEAEGLMARARTPAFCCPDDVVFTVTDAGRRLALRLLPEPPKQTRYDEYLCSEYSESFADYLGINVPEYESRGDWRNREYRMRRWVGLSSYIDVQGEWARTKKEAKASYKAALKANWAARRSVA
ncbi:hypothetical protein ACFOJE_16945 [Azotobacter bryophylli]|uniref:Uncharacterized protein n=1 Tax=Azotobacter bryophylli TaxID=1986537 RepID=A0ABV7AXW0_9GAMM